RCRDTGHGPGSPRGRGERYRMADLYFPEGTMPGIDRSTRPETLARFREEFDLAQEGFGEHFGLSLATVQRYEVRGAPKWMSYAMVGWSIVEGRVAPEGLRPFWEGRIQLCFRRWPPARDPVLRWESVFGPPAASGDPAGHPNAMVARDCTT